jgi:hypothetical protein
MRWTCPHCATGLALSDDAVSRPDSPPWRLIACYRCGGFSMVQTRVQTQSPAVQPRIISARRGEPKALTERSRPAPQVPVAQVTPRSTAIPPPIPRAALSQAVARNDFTHHPEPVPVGPFFAQTRDEGPADFRRLQAKWTAERKRRKPSPVAPSPKNETQINKQISGTVASPRISVQRLSALSALLVVIAISGGMLLTQGRRLQNSVAQLEDSKEPAQSEFTDEIRSKRAAPMREPLRQNPEAIRGQRAD